MLHFFRHKMIFEKWFRHLPVFGGSENKSQPQNDFPLIKKYLVNFGKWFTLFKRINHFPETADVVDHLLNDAVDLHAQVVDHRRILRQAIFRHWSESAGAGIWKFLSESSDVWPPSLDFNDTVPNSSQTSRNPARMVGSRPSGRDLTEIRPKLVGIWPF